MKRSPVFALFCCVLWIGCARQPEHAALGRHFLLADEPAGAVGIIDYHESDPKPADVTLVGEGPVEWALPAPKGMVALMIRDGQVSACCRGHCQGPCSRI